ncbi:MAG: Holliday junction branch migration protein RuvA, partial [Candidatus Dadabacteria bacterium]
LEALGYPARVAAEAVRKAAAGGASGVEALVKAALKTLAPRK